MASFHINSALASSDDIQRNYMFQLEIPTDGISSDSKLGVEELIVRVRSAQMPQRGTQTIESLFMGTKQFFPGKVEFAGSLSVEIEEMEDLKVSKFINEWQDTIFDYNPNSGGKSKKRKKEDYVKKITLTLYRHNGEKAPYKIEFFNAWPESINDSDLNYSGNESVKRNVTFKYDRYEIVKND